MDIWNSGHGPEQIIQGHFPTSIFSSCEGTNKSVQPRPGVDRRGYAKVGGHCRLIRGNRSWRPVCFLRLSLSGCVHFYPYPSPTSLVFDSQSFFLNPTFFYKDRHVLTALRRRSFGHLCSLCVGSLFKPQQKWVADVCPLFLAAFAADCTRSYTVQAGDICDTISQSHNVST